MKENKKTILSFKKTNVNVKYLLIYDKCHKGYNWM